MFPIGTWLGNLAAFAVTMHALTTSSITLLVTLSIISPLLLVPVIIYVRRTIARRRYQDFRGNDFYPSEPLQVQRKGDESES